MSARRRMGVWGVSLALMIVSTGGVRADLDREASDVPPVLPNFAAATVERVLPAVVKLYGASLGSIKDYGTGVVVSEKGEIVTIDSVLLDAENLRAVLWDGRRFRAEVVRRDPVRELALVRIEANRLAALTPGSSRDLSPGDPVIAAGNCFRVAEGEEPVTFMYGVLSARTSIELRRRAQPLDYGGEILVTDSIISNPGMAGGPLLDVEGTWVGVIGPLADSELTNTRVNYAIPIEEVRSFLGGSARPAVATTRPGVESRGRGGRAYLGLHLFTLGYRRVAAYVDRVDADSPAAAAGIRPDDLIIAINGRRVGTIEDYRALTEALRPGQTVEMSLRRGKAVVSVTMVAGAGP